jgi:glycosyltransferase involved in cell wall biosynthesis
MAHPRVSVVITGYARPDLLRRAVESLQRVTAYPNLEWVLADDASPPEQQQAMRALPFDRFVFAEENRGLGANANAGLAAATGEYVLQLQDDWVCAGPPDFIERGVQVFQSRDDVGMVRFMAPESYLPYRIADGPDGLPVRIYRPQPGSECWIYSDWPHLKSRRFIDFIGPYRESRSMQETEMDMRERYHRQSRYVVAYIEGYEMFEHVGEAESHRTPRLRDLGKRVFASRRKTADG